MNSSVERESNLQGGFRGKIWVLGFIWRNQCISKQEDFTNLPHVLVSFRFSMVYNTLGCLNSFSRSSTYTGSYLPKLSNIPSYTGNFMPLKCTPTSINRATSTRPLPLTCLKPICNTTAHQEEEDEDEEETAAEEDEEDASSQITLLNSILKHSPKHCHPTWPVA